MQIEALESIKWAGPPLSPGDRVTVDDEVGSRWCRAGWAKDMSGTVETGERRVINAKLSVDNLVTVQSAKEAG